MALRNSSASADVICRGSTYAPIALFCTSSVLDATNSAISSVVAVYPVLSKNAAASSCVVASGSYSVFAVASVSEAKFSASPCPTYAAASASVNVSPSSFAIFCNSSRVTWRGSTYCEIRFDCSVSATCATNCATCSSVGVYPRSAKYCRASASVTCRGST